MIELSSRGEKKGAKARERERETTENRCHRAKRIIALVSKVAFERKEADGGLLMASKKEWVFSA